MSEIEVREYLGAYACGTLTAAEERELHQAALDDQELFDALAEEALLREALSDEAFRRRLKRRLRRLNREEFVRNLVSGLGARFRRQAVVWAWGLAAIVLGIGVYSLFEVRSPVGPVDRIEPAVEPSSGKGISSPRESGAVKGIDSESWEWLWDLGRTGRTAGVELELDRRGAVPRYEVGGRMRVGFSVSRDAVVVLLAKAPGGAVTRRFPNRRRPSASVRANERVMVPRAGQGALRVAGPPGRHRLRLLAFPPGTDLGDATSVGRVRPHVAERQFQVVR